MKLPLNRSRSASRGNFPLRLILAGPFVLQIIVTVSVTGWLSLRNGQQAVNDVARQLREEVTARIHQHLRTYTETAHQINQINYHAIRLGSLNPENSELLQRHFFSQIEGFSQLSYILFGSEQKDFVGLRRSSEGAPEIEISNRSTGYNFRTYATEAGTLTKLLQVKPNYDPRTRPWYRTAVQAGKPIWSKIYAAFGSKKLTLTAARPVYSPTNQLLGVVGSNLTLNDINEFLRTLKIGRSGQTFIMERSAELVASSTFEPTLIRNGNLSQRVVATSSQNRLTRTAAEHLIQYFGDLKEIRGSQQLDFLWQDQRQFLQVTSLSDGWGLDWLIVVVVAEADFMDQIRANTRTTILLCLLALATAMVSGIYTSRWIARPIIKLRDASRAIADGQLNQKVEAGGIWELDSLALSFNQMAAGQLWESFVALETAKVELEMRVEQRTTELLEAQIAADVANRAKGEFIANMSHELRIPLNGILGYAQILERSPQLNSELRDNVRVIYQCGSHLLTLLNDILDLSKIEAQKMALYPTDFDFCSFVAGVVEINRIKAQQKQIAFSYQPTGELPKTVYADEKRLRQVLINLLGNAIKFTEQGGVTFKVSLVESDLAAIPQSSDSPRGLTIKVRFQIEDTGIGISEEQLNHIFLPFEQVGKKSQQIDGSGLGLAISHKIIQMMSSNIQVQSQPGIGSIFWFDLDLVQILQESEQPAPLSNPKITGYLGEVRRILILEPDREQGSKLWQLLSSLGFERFETPQDLAQFHQSQGYPDLILVDWDMGRLKAEEILLRIQNREEFTSIPIFILSSSSAEGERSSRWPGRVNEFLLKPVSPDALLEKLQQHLHIEWIYAEKPEINSPPCFDFLYTTGLFICSTTFLFFSNFIRFNYERESQGNYETS